MKYILVKCVIVSHMSLLKLLALRIDIAVNSITYSLFNTFFVNNRQRGYVIFLDMSLIFMVLSETIGIVKLNHNHNFVPLISTNNMELIRRSLNLLRSKILWDRLQSRPPNIQRETTCTCNEQI